MESTLKVVSYSDVMKIIGTWTPFMRFTLMKELLKTLEPEFKGTSSKRRKTLDQALGLLATNESPPSDEEVQQFLDEYRMEKYG